MTTQNPSTQPRYIWQHRAWPQLTLDATALAPALDHARLEQGRLLGLLGAIGLEQANEVQRELWVQEALATAAIEGQQLNLESLRSSVAHRLALADAPGADRSVTDKYARITGISKATAARDLADLAAHGLLRIEGLGKATRYVMNVPGWEQPALKP
jgi:Fic family protein